MTQHNEPTFLAELCDRAGYKVHERMSHGGRAYDWSPKGPMDSEAFRTKEAAQADMEKAVDRKLNSGRSLWEIAEIIRAETHPPATLPEPVDDGLVERAMQKTIDRLHREAEINRTRLVDALAEIAQMQEAIDNPYVVPTLQLAQKNSEIEALKAEIARKDAALRLAEHELQASAPFVGAQGAADVFRAADACRAALNPKETNGE